MATSLEIPKTYEVPDSDFSGRFLDALLGKGWDTFGTSGFGGDSAAELMLQIFGAFNTVSMTMVMVLFVWTTLISVIGTSHEGVAFGKKYSSVWMPIRFACSIGALAPIFKGLSFFQIAILAVLGWSINLGNFVWNLGANYFIEQGGQLTVQAPVYPTQNFTSISNGILKSLVLQQYMSERANLNVPNMPGTWSYSNNLIQDGGVAVFTFGGNFGRITIDCLDQGDAMCVARQNAVSNAISSLQPIAQALADPDTDAGSIDQAGLYNAAQAVQDALLSGLQNTAAQGNSQLNSKLQAFRQTSEEFGWFAAGASYWSISWINQETRAAMYGGFAYKEGGLSASEIQAMSMGLPDYPAVMLRYENYVNSGYGERRGIPEAVSDPNVMESGLGPIDAVAHILSKSFTGVFPTAVSLFGENDPISVLSSIGDWFLDIAWGLLAALGVSFGITVGAGAFSWMPVAGGVIHQAAIASGPFIVFILFAIFLPLTIYGITLAFFLPAIPFIRWMAGLAAWVILVVETIVAAPLWLAAHALPEGDGLAGQHGKRGYMLLLGVLLRPPLMVAGFFVAVLLINVMGRLLGKLFLLFTDGVMQTKTIGLVGSVSMLIILGIVVLMLVNKFFGLAQHLPEHIINWIGQQFHNLGESADSAGARSSFAGSTNAVNSAGHSLGGSANARFSNAKKKAEADAANSAAKADITDGNTSSRRAPDQSSLV